MERHDILEMMGTLKLAGMRHAYDEVVADAVKRQHSAQRVVGDLADESGASAQRGNARGRIGGTAA